MSARRPSLTILAALVALAVLGAGCGDDEGGDAGDGGAARTVSGGEPVGPADEGIEGVEAFEIAEASHTAEPLAYDPRPPAGGEHNPVPATCGFYESDPPADQHLVHSLEHGAIWVAFEPDLDDAGRQVLRDLVAGQPKVVATPYDDLEAPVVVTAWARQLELDGVDDPRLEQFVDQYQAGGASPEPGAACAGVGEPAVLAGSG